MTRNIPPYAIAYGVPATVHRFRFDAKKIEGLMEWRWWDWPENVLQDNIGLFQQELDEKVIDRIQKIYDEMG